MSIPLVRNNTKDAINTSIIAIKKNLERINSLLGLADSSAPDLSGLATKQELEDAVTEINNTIDEVETSLAPVDSITSGDMHAVTSNAVANSNAMPVDTVTSGDMHSVTSNAVANVLSNKCTTQNINNNNAVIRNRINEEVGLATLDIRDDSDTGLSIDFYYSQSIIRIYKIVNGVVQGYKTATLS